MSRRCDSVLKIQRKSKKVRILLLWCSYLDEKVIGEKVIDEIKINIEKPDEEQKISVIEDESKQVEHEGDKKQNDQAEKQAENKNTLNAQPDFLLVEENKSIMKSAIFFKPLLYCDSIFWFWIESYQIV